MQVAFRTPPPSNTSGVVTIAAGGTVGELRSAVASALGTEPRRLRLAAKGTMLRDDEAAVAAPSVVAVVLSEGAAAPAPAAAAPAAEEPPRFIPTVRGLLPAEQAAGAALSAFVLYDFTAFADLTPVHPAREPHLKYLNEDMQGTSGLRHGTVEAIRCAPTRRMDNLRASDADWEVVRADMQELYDEGCRLVVCMSTPDSGRDISLLRSISASVGINLVASTGYHMCPPFESVRRKVHPPVADLEARLREDLAGDPPACGAVAFSPLPDGTASTEYWHACVAAAVGAGAPLYLSIPSGCTPSVLVSLLETARGQPGAEPPRVVVCGALGRVALSAGEWAALLSEHANVAVAADCLGWGGLHRDGVHALGGDAAPASVLRAVLEAVPAGRLVLGSGHCMKMCLASWGGPGRVALLREHRRFVQHTPQQLRDAAVAALCWYSAPPAEPEEVRYWSCDKCGKQSEEVTPDGSFRRLTYRYCSIACLRAHEEELSKGQSDGGGGGTRRRQQQQSSAVAWGIPATR
eukprot:TRINITY_DN24945_c0_g1_i2.p1 TRINITY_DN24945_c0_g1~~TRINITY_DN24945_c0_g1_i2.p1  ORF type:complete len:538 (+),score=153.23 TRINITY_DN24945_c0_g1_i2:52-1614(+)